MGNVSLSTLCLTMVQPSDESAIRDFYELRGAVTRADWPQDPPPCWVNELGRVRHPWPGIKELVWVARGGPSNDESMVGGCLMHLTMLDNLRNATVEILVAPEHRRQGIGRALLAHLRDEATQHGRIRLITHLDHPLDPAEPDPGARFATACGAQLALVETRRRLDVTSVDSAVLARLDRAARQQSRGYSLVQWVGSTPRQWLDDMAYLTARMSTDAPLGELQWNAEAYDAGRLRGRDTSFLARGMQMITTGAVHESSGRLVAFTQIIGYTTASWYADQEDTIVAPEHRGHRLGTLIKVANLELARTQRPDLRVIDTWNADANPYMVSINEAMGFRPYARSGEWQLDL